ncbi:hypothetical protein E2C01_049535 [Portunus trituberculatus]|uniref:Uncharacterized protein n=1 Tax=Portunus trituberculatus TaxID=210409 RepID=A0A5B7GE67_PORTR|nr:hypothetical protein [Portunus trituberculatus]
MIAVHPPPSPPPSTTNGCVSLPQLTRGMRLSSPLSSNSGPRERSQREVCEAAIPALACLTLGRRAERATRPLLQLPLYAFHTPSSSLSHPSLSISQPPPGVFLMPVFVCSGPTCVLRGTTDDETATGSDIPIMVTTRSSQDA